MATSGRLPFTVKPAPGWNRGLRARLLLVLAALLWSSGGLLIKSIEIRPLAIAGGRSLIAALVILVYLGRPKIGFSVPRIGGALAYAVTVIFFVLANKLTTAANAIVLQYTAPVYVAVAGSLFLGEKTGKKGWAAIVVACGGMVLFFLDRLDAGSMLGNGYALLSGVGFAALAVFLRLQKDGSPAESVLLGNVITALICLPFLAGSEPSSRDLFFLVLLGVFQLAFPYICYSIAIKELRALEAILIPIIEPLLNPVWVFLLIGETPGFLSLLGGVAVLGAVGYYSYSRHVFNGERREGQVGS